MSPTLTAPARKHVAARGRLEGLSQLVDRTLERALPKAASLPQVIHEAMRYCVFSGGKRFRPLLCLGGAEAVGAPSKKALCVACAIELLHTYSLVHDDLPAMDNADERRGQPTCHRKFGEGNAILVGDALLTLAFEWLSRDGSSNTLPILHEIGSACGTVGLIGGQVLDLQAISQPRSSTERFLRDIAQRKTAALITASVVSGGLAGGGKPDELKRLRRYGHMVGFAFQLIDDVHDRDGLAQVIGIEAARLEATRLIGRAQEALEPFGRRAHTLQMLAGWLLETAK